MEHANCPILVAEDSSVLRLVLKRTFSAAGFPVVTAVDGADAWRICQQRDFGLIVTDEQMPGMCGSELCTLLRKTARFAEIPILMVTVKAYELDRNWLRSHLGISDVFVKPFSPRKVLQAAQYHLAESVSDTP